MSGGAGTDTSVFDLFKIGIGPSSSHTMGELLAHGRAHGLPLARMLRANELARMPEAALDAGLARIWQAMRGCIARGLAAEGRLRAWRD